ncbi:OLC1v1003067C1 [Oldenlandia corymbosa var. corymbosa]|uniref:OLC1v1003067C1 n=1 Tax=Oldenlandia corymbosa var. corymbosa TaxID=529605 RepID=A0AAV1D9D4_OLDCO|nr:OLC1v1003067C1 [Oldenlandia corymbosa var. corymbosa]
MKPMETIQDLIEEAKLRTVWWALCIFAVSYFLTHTSKSMWMNIPIAVLLVSGLRILLNEVEFHWKVQKGPRPTYLSHLEKKQLSVNDSRLSTSPPPPKWKRKIDSPIVEAAIEDFVNKLMQDFVVDLWYFSITPDKDAPQLIHGIIMDALGEVSGRVKEINLVDLLTRDVVDLVGDHIDLFRRNQATIGVDVMGTLSSEERDDRLKHHLLASKELHPALASADCEYKYLQRLMGGVLAVLLRPRESQCPLVRCIAREILTCLVMQPVLNLASPWYINQLIESILIALKDGLAEGGLDQSINAGSQNKDHSFGGDSVKTSESVRKKSAASNNQGTDVAFLQIDRQRLPSFDTQDGSVSNTVTDEPTHSRSGDWARALEAATQRRTEVLTPENLENMWAIGRNYKKKLQSNVPGKIQAPALTGSVNREMLTKDSRNEGLSGKSESHTSMGERSMLQLPPKPNADTGLGNRSLHTEVSSREGTDASTSGGVETSGRLRRSNSTSDLVVQSKVKDQFASTGGTIISDYYIPNSSRHNEVRSVKSGLDMVVHGETGLTPKLKCRVVGAYFEKIASKSFAVYSIAVTDADKNTWFVKRRYRNFERLHRQLKDIPNYTLHLPPKRIFSSSTEDTFVHQRCIQLDKYLQDLLSIANVAEQHEVWDFLSASSKNYSFGKSPSVMKTLAVNVDDAMDDIVRQFKGVSDGFMKKVVGSPSSLFDPALAASVPGRHVSWNADDMNKLALTQSASESVNSFSDNDEVDKDGHHTEEAESSEQANGWHSDNELNTKGFPPRVVKRDDDFGNLEVEKKHGPAVFSEPLGQGKVPDLSLILASSNLEDPVGVPPEWTPPNLSLPMLNLVDNIFQLKKRGWLRRQVFWISKQILQLMMEDAIDDWLLREIHWLRRDDVVAYGIRWVEDILWPDGKFFLKLSIQSGMDDEGSVQIESTASKTSRPGSFEQQLEAARRASDVKKLLFDGAPSALVSLIGHKQYHRCARDLYYFLQSTICLKQLAFAILELVIVSIFPELRDLVVEINEKMRAEL